MMQATTIGIFFFFKHWISFPVSGWNYQLSYCSLKLQYNSMKISLKDIDGKKRAIQATFNTSVFNYFHRKPLRYFFHYLCRLIYETTIILMQFLFIVMNSFLSRQCKWLVVWNIWYIIWFNNPRYKVWNKNIPVKSNSLSTFCCWHHFEHKDNILF